MVDIQEKEAEQHIKDSFAMDAGCPEQDRRKKEDCEGCEGVIWKTAAEDAEQGDIPQEDEEGKKEGVYRHVVE
jgi:hypothetical protein